MFLKNIYPSLEPAPLYPANLGLLEPQDAPLLPRGVDAEVNLVVALLPLQERVTLPGGVNGKVNPVLVGAAAPLSLHGDSGAIVVFRRVVARW